MERIEIGRYTDGECGDWVGWITPEYDEDHQVPKWMLKFFADGTVRLGRRDDEKDELFFS